MENECSTIDYLQKTCDKLHQWNANINAAIELVKKLQKVKDEKGLTALEMNEIKKFEAFIKNFSEIVSRYHAALKEIEEQNQLIQKSIFIQQTLIRNNYLLDDNHQKTFNNYLETMTYDLAVKHNLF